MALLVRSYPIALALALICLALYGAARLGWRALSQDAAIVVLQAPLVVAVFLWRGGSSGLPGAVMVSAKLAVASLSALWVQRTTRFTDISGMLSKWLPPRAAFVIAMSLHFLPMLARDAREIYALQRLRGARIEARDLLNPLRWAEACHCIAIPLLIRSLHLSDQVAVAASQRAVGSETFGKQWRERQKLQSATQKP
jgi:energy-coupling factor transport system permease protein